MHSSQSSCIMSSKYYGSFDPCGFLIFFYFIQFIIFRLISGGSGSYMIAMNERTYKLIGTDYPGNRAEDVINPGLTWMIGFMFVVSFLGLFSLVPLRKVS